MPAGQGNQDIYGRVFGPSGIENLIGSEATILQSPDKQELGQKVMKDVQGSEGCYSSWSGKAKEDDRFYNGNQWDDIDRMNMEQQKRPALTFNDIKPVIDAVSGMERLNRNDVRVISRPFDSPAELDMEGDLATEALAVAEDMCAASEEDSECAHRMAVVGMSWCLAGDTEVQSPRILAGHQRLYSGRIIDVYLKGGKVLTGTPNHPVLTNRGWQGLGDLHEGDYLISGELLKRIEGSAIDFNHGVALLQDKVCAFGVGRKLGAVATIPDDFHGDGIGSEIHVVRADRFLWNQVVGTTLLKQLQQFALILGRWRTALFANSLAEANFIPTPDYGPFGLGQPRSPQMEGFGASSWGAASLAKQARHITFGKSQFRFNLQRGIACVIALFNNLNEVVRYAAAPSLPDFAACFGQAGFVAMPSEQLTQRAWIDLQPFRNCSNIQTLCMKVQQLIHRYTWMAALWSQGVACLTQSHQDGGAAQANYSSNLAERKLLTKVQLGQLIGGHTDGELPTVVAERIVSRHVDHFPVYNLSTVNQLYVANGVVSSNCEIRMDYSRDINGRVIREKIPEFEMRWDPGAKKANLEDRDWCARKLKVSRKKFDKRWPDMLATVDLAVPEMPYGQTDKYELVTPYYSMGNEKANPQVGSQNAVKKDVEVIQYQWRDEETIYRFQDENTGELITKDEDHWDTMVDRLQQLGADPPPSVRQTKPVYKQVFVCRGVVLEDPIELPGGFSLICLTGKWDMDQKRHYGLVHPMKDPQKTKNKAISSALGFHITNAKGGVIFKTSFFADPVNAKDQWSQPNAWVEADDKADLSKDIIFRKPSEMPQELGMFYSESQKAITRSSGISEEMVGIAMGQTPSQTAKGRTQAGVVVLGWYWDNLARYRKECARVMLEFIREYWTQGQLLQVGGDYNKQSIPLLKESMPDEYSFVLDESIRHNPNLKAQVWNDMLESGTLAQLVKMNLGRVVLQLLKYSPYPAQVVADIQREVQQNPPQIPQKGQGKGPAAQKKDDPNMVMAKTRLYGSQAEKALAQAREIDQKPALERAKLAAKLQSDHMKAQLQQQKAGQQMQMAQHKQNLQLQMQNQRNQQQMAQSWIRGMQPQQGMGGDSGMGGGDIP